MDKKTTDIVAYLTWVGLLVALVMGDRTASRFHLNQSLVIWIAGTLAGIAGSLLEWIPLIGLLAGLGVTAVKLLCVACWVIGIVAAIQGEEKPIPVLGQIQLLH